MDKMLVGGGMFREQLIGLSKYDLEAKYARHKVKEIAPIKLYLIRSGRNAWQSTWITQYTEQTIQPDLASAIEQAETQRRKGDVYYILEMPALAFTTAQLCLVCTQFSELEPFRDFVRRRVERRLMPGKLSSDVKKTAETIHRPLSLAEVGGTMYSESGFWSKRPSGPAGVIFKVYPLGEPKWAPLTKDLACLRSRGTGSIKPLEWKPAEFATVSKSTFRVAGYFNRLVQ